MVPSGVDGGSHGRAAAHRARQRQRRPARRDQALRRRSPPSTTSASSSAEGEFFTLLGPSGCGKTTTLRMIAGFEQPSEGEIRIEGEDVAGLPPHKRPTNTVFQSYALFPHLSVEDNVAFGLKRKGVGKDEIAERVATELRRVGLAARGQPPARPALRRDAAAGGAGPGAGQPAEGAAARRAARRPRPEAAQGPADRAEADPARGRDHLRLRHPRPGGGADDERPDRGHEPRQGRAGRRVPRRSTSARGRPSSPASSASPT